MKLPFERLALQGLAIDDKFALRRRFEDYANTYLKGCPFGTEEIPAFHIATSYTLTFTTSTTLAGHFFLDSLSAISVTAAHRSLSRTGAPEIHHLALATGHSTKSATTVEKALEAEKDLLFQTLLPGQFEGLHELPRRSYIGRNIGGNVGLRRFIRKIGSK